MISSRKCNRKIPGTGFLQCWPAAGFLRKFQLENTLYLRYIFWHSRCDMVRQPCDC